MQTTFEKLGGTYRQMGDYLLPDIEAPESPQIGIWGQRRLQNLCTNKRVLYTAMLMGDTLKVHLEEVDKSAEEMFNQLTVQLRLCCAYERKAFIDGLQYGAFLMRKLFGSI